VNFLLLSSFSLVNIKMKAISMIWLQNSAAVDATMDPRMDRATSTPHKELGLESFSAVVDAYQARVHGFVRRMVGTHEDAEDITQEVFIRAFQNYDRFDSRASVRTWLFRIAHNLCVDRARRLGRRVTEVPLTISADVAEPVEFADNRWQPDTILEDSQLMEMVEAAIAQMSEKLRSVLILHDKEDLSYQEIADTLDLPVGTVKSRLFLARANLQAAVKQLLEDTV
jgi:RNA polymerase sigma-70 factor, ECF subfamily